MSDALNRLAAVIEARKTASARDSYVAGLLDRGMNAILKKVGEEAKVALRNQRRDGNEMLKSLEKDKEITEDELKRGEKEIQELTDDYVARVDQVVAEKEKDLMEI